MQCNLTKANYVDHKSKSSLGLVEWCQSGQIIALGVKYASLNDYQNISILFVNIEKRQETLKILK